MAYIYDFVLECGRSEPIVETFEFDEEPTERELNEAINDWVLSNCSFYWNKK